MNFNTLPPWNFFMLFCADFFSKSTFQKIILGIPSECQTDWIHIRPNILSGLVWVQTVWKGYQQMKLESKELSSFFTHPQVILKSIG